MPADNEPPRRFRLVLKSEFEALDGVVDQCESFVNSCVSDEELAYKVVLLTTEAVTNAIEHGNALDASKTVVLDVVVTDHRIEIRVEDEGEGFDRSEVENPTREVNLLNTGGRGIFFIEHMADEVHYEKDGRCIRILFHRDA